MLIMIQDLPKQTGIYLIRNKANGKVWVGQASGKEGIYQRCKGHLSAFRCGNNSVHMQRAWDSFGADAFEFSVLLLCDRDQLNDQENYYISLYKSGDSEKGYNIKQRAYGPGTISEETKQKISQIKMGHSVSEETRKKISDRCKNPSEEVRKRISEGKKGKKPSEETRKKLSEGQKRRFHREQALT